MEYIPATIFLCSLTISYWSRRPAYLNFLDPLQIIALSEGVWAATVYGLWSEGVATDLQAEAFTLCIAMWWTAWRIASVRLGPRYINAVKSIWIRVSQIDGFRSGMIISLFTFGLLITLAVTIANGGGGDNRLVVIKLLRPIESLTALLPPVVLFILFTKQTRSSLAIAVFLLLGMIAVGGKSSILQIVIPLSGMVLIGRIQLNFKVIASVFAVAALGFSASIMLNYGVQDPSLILSALIERISLDGDVYILSFTNDIIGETTTTSLLAYLLGPLIKLFFLPIHVDQSIGSQIGALIRNEDTVNGPNPHWPVVLLAYHLSLFQIFLLTIPAFALIMWIKFRLIAFRNPSSWPIWAVIPFFSYVLLYSQTFYSDPSFPEIYLIQAAVLSAVLFVVLRPWTIRPPIIARRRRSPHPQEAD